MSEFRLHERTDFCKLRGCKVTETHAAVGGSESKGHTNEISITIRGQERVAIVMEALRKSGFVALAATGTDSSGHEANDTDSKGQNVPSPERSGR